MESVDLLPLFAAFDSTNYLRWCSLYLEDMHKLEETAPTVHQAFVDGKFAVKRTPGSFIAVGGDMALEQTINKSQKSPAGIIGNSRKKRYVAKWEILYHEMLAISNLHRDISGSHSTNYDLEVNRNFSAATTASDERDIVSIIDVIERNENPFASTVQTSKLHNLMTNEVASDQISQQLLDAENIGKASYAKFREERFVNKSVRISDTIHRTNLNTFGSVPESNEAKLKKPKVSKSLIANQKKIP